MSGELIQLPNGDLWRGHSDVLSDTANAQIERVREEIGNPVNRAMAQVLKTSKGAQELTCVWCGFQSAEKDMRAHIKEAHAVAIGLSGPSDAQALYAQNAQLRLELDKAKE